LNKNAGHCPAFFIWKSIVSKVTDAGDELFALFERSVSPPQSRNKKKTAPQSESQISQSLDWFYGEAQALRQKHKLGLIARARVIRHFQARVIAAGYEPDLVKRVIFALILSAFIGRTN
jgi:hypothetical protein